MAMSASAASFNGGQSEDDDDDTVNMSPKKFLYENCISGATDNSLPHGLGLLTTVASLPPEYRSRYLTIRTKCEIPLDLSVKHSPLKSDKNIVPMTVNSENIDTTENNTLLLSTSDNNSNNKVNKVNDTIYNYVTITTCTENIEIDDIKQSNNNNNVITNGEQLNCDREKHTDLSDSGDSRLRYNLQPISPPISPTEQIHNIETNHNHNHNNNHNHNHNIERVKYQNQNQCGTEQIEGIDGDQPVSHLNSAKRMKYNTIHKNVSPKITALEFGAKSSELVLHGGRKETEEELSMEMEMEMRIEQQNVTPPPKKLQENVEKVQIANTLTGTNNNNNNNNSNSGENRIERNQKDTNRKRSDGKSNINRIGRKHINYKKDNNSTNIGNNRSVVTRKLKFDGDTSSPVSGTIIRPLEDITDGAVHYSNGDIDPEYNIVEITEKTKAQLAAIKNVIGDYICKLCRLKFEDAFGLAQHRCACIVLLEYRCPECGKQFNCPANLASHQRWHKPPRESTANQSNTSNTTDSYTATKYSYKRDQKHQHHNQHNNQHHHHNNNNMISVKENRLTKPTANNYNENVRVDELQQYFNCQECGKKFRKEAYLKKHQVIHSRNNNTSEQQQQPVKSKPFHKKLPTNNNSKLSIVNKSMQSKTIKSPEKPNRPLENEPNCIVKYENPQDSTRTSRITDHVTAHLSIHEPLGDLLPTELKSSVVDETIDDFHVTTKNSVEEVQLCADDIDIHTSGTPPTAIYKNDTDFIDLDENMEKNAGTLFTCSEITLMSMSSSNYEHLQRIGTNLTEEENIAATALTHLRNCASVIQHTTTLSH